MKTFDSWRCVPRAFATRRQWQRRGRKVLPEAKPAARLIYTYESSPDTPSFDEVWVNDADLRLLVGQEVPLFHVEQTAAIQQTPRTLACQAFEDIFLVPALRDDYIRWNPMKPNARHPGELGNWETVHAGNNDYLSEAIVRRHINQRAIIGIKSAPHTRFVAIDHDFHGQDRNVFFDQAEVLLDRFHGNGWHYQVAEQDIDGMHYLRVFDSPRNLTAVRWMLRQQLQELDAANPELAERSRAAGMKSLGQLEIYPSPKRGFRLPLCRGRETLLDRPLLPVKYRKRLAQDVEGYVSWLRNEKRRYMPKERILTLLWQNLAPARPKVFPVVSSTGKLKHGEGSGLGKLAGCCRQKLTGFWNGTFSPPKSLNHALIVTARISSFEKVAESRACDLLRQYVSDLSPHAHRCSDRLMQGDRQSIDRCIVSSVALAYNSNSGQPDVETSTAKLRESVACWQRGGFLFSDKATWDTCWARYAAIPDFAWTLADEHDIVCWLQPALGKRCPSSALDVAQGMVKLAAVKHSQENGIEYKYWQAFLGGEFGVVCGNRNKLHGILQAAKDLELLAIHSSAIWFSDSRKGFATIYCPGKRVEERVMVGSRKDLKTPTS